MSEVIATKTKILAWAVVGDKERIDFDLCDFSPDQVAGLDRLIRAEGENKVELSIEPEQKKLQIAPIVSTVRLVSLACRTKGQKLKIAEFKSPDERATAIKRMSGADTPLLLSIRELQKGMFDGSHMPSGSHAEKSEGHEVLTFKASGMKKAGVTIYLHRRGDGSYGGGFEWALGNYGGSKKSEDTAWYDTKAYCLEDLGQELQQALAGMEIKGSADARRATESRRDTLREQVELWLDGLLAEAKAGDGSQDTDHEEEDDGDAE